MQKRDLSGAYEWIGLAAGICGVIAIIGLVGCAVLLMDHAPQFQYCCDDGGDTYYGPSWVVTLAAIVMFPFTMAIGLIAGLFLGYWQVSLGTAAMIAAYVFLKGWSEDLENAFKERVRREAKEVYDRNRGMSEPS